MAQQLVLPLFLSLLCLLVSYICFSHPLNEETAFNLLFLLQGVPKELSGVDEIDENLSFTKINLWLISCTSHRCLSNLGPSYDLFKSKNFMLSKQHHWNIFEWNILFKLVYVVQIHRFFEFSIDRLDPIYYVISSVWPLLSTLLGYFKLSFFDEINAVYCVTFLEDDVFTVINNWLAAGLGDLPEFLLTYGLKDPKTIEKFNICQICLLISLATNLFIICFVHAREDAARYTLDRCISRCI
jgi:hypothetical protein